MGYSKISILCFIVLVSLKMEAQNIQPSNNMDSENLYKSILKSKKKFELIIFLKSFGKYDYKSELEAEFCGKQEDQDGTALYFKLLDETNKSHSIPINYKKFKNSKYYDLIKVGHGKKFKIKGRIKTSPYGNVYLRVDHIKSI